MRFIIQIHVHTACFGRQNKIRFQKKAGATRLLISEILREYARFQSGSLESTRSAQSKTPLNGPQYFW